MCGISGYLDLDRGVDMDTLRRMTDVIRHRGPDDEGYALIGKGGAAFYRGEDTLPQLSLPPLEQGGSGTFLGLGHRRLSILDLSAAGHQPMALPERDLTLTYNGELYNYLELRAQLEALGHRFRTNCDTEVLLHAYCQWGEDCLDHFNGMWGFALWDGKENKLFCARDRLGAKPLHYYHNANKLLLGSELKQLCQDPTIRRTFNRPYLAANLMYRLGDYDDETLIEGMRALPPGHKLVVQVAPEGDRIVSVTVTPYWTLHVRYDDSYTQAQWEEQVAEEFSRACRWRLRSDAPVAALLSGGLDSSCMVTELCGQMSDPAQLHTFTTSYPGDASCDEWYFADLVNRACGCTGNQILPAPTDIEGQFENVVWHTEGLCGLSLLGVKALLEQVRSQGYKVVLNGQCGDELMLGYERYYAFYFSWLLKTGRIRRLLREFPQAGRHSRLHLHSLAAYVLYFDLPMVRDTRQLHRAERFVKRDLLEMRKKAQLHELLYPRSLEQLQYLELTATQLPNIVRMDDRLFMSASLESRIPFMDYQFVELACRIPPEYKIREGYTKYLMRCVFDARMPREVTWRTNKLGFGAPVDAWARQVSLEYLLSLIRNARTAPYFWQDALEALALRSPVHPAVFEFLTMESFARQFDVSV